jgi:hypothetical protein
VCSKIHPCLNHSSLFYFVQPKMCIRLPSAQTYLDLPLSPEHFQRGALPPAVADVPTLAYGIFHVLTFKIKLTNRRMVYNGPNHTYPTCDCIRYVETVVSFLFQCACSWDQTKCGLSLPIIRPFNCFTGQGLVGTHVIYVVCALFVSESCKKTNRMKHVGCCIKM